MRKGYFISALLKETCIAFFVNLWVGTQEQDPTTCLHSSPQALDRLSRAGTALHAAPAYKHYLNKGGPVQYS